MHIRTFLSAEEAMNEAGKSHTAIVIDILRASSVISAAIENGASKIKAFLTIEETVKFKEENPKEDILLCGERKRVLIEGFDLGNSPEEYKKEIVSGKTLAITTTNGTKAIEYSKDAIRLYVASLLNLNAVCSDIEENCQSVSIVCSGTEGRISLDDVACAGKAIKLILDKTDCTLDDGSILAYNFYKNGRGDIRELIKESASYNGVIEAGFSKDIEFCLKEDIYQSVPIWKNGFIVKK